jgi:hypothetical protein
MSHFSVTVVGDVENVLAPYDENKEVDPYVKHNADEVERVFKQHKVDCYARQRKGEPLNAFDVNTLSMDHVTSEWWGEWDYGDLDAAGNGTSTYNPKSKWDWHELGGRWTGELILKKGKKGILGRPGVFNNKPAHNADSARICDIDWAAMKKNAEKRAAETWDDIITPSKESKEWYKQEYLDTRKADHLKIYGTKKEYVRRSGFWTTHDLVTENEWISPGELFGSGDDPENRDTFTKKFVSTLKSLPPETTISVVDYHI